MFFLIPLTEKACFGGAGLLCVQQPCQPAQGLIQLRLPCLGTGRMIVVNTQVIHRMVHKSQYQPAAILPAKDRP